jgi:hypothetical protein
MEYEFRQKIEQINVEENQLYNDLQELHFKYKIQTDKTKKKFQIPPISLND